jgi:hypothetical protein
VLLHNRILTSNRFLVFALLTLEKCELLTIRTCVLLHRVEHVSARRTELHLCYSRHKTRKSFRFGGNATPCIILELLGCTSEFFCVILGVPNPNQFFARLANQHHQFIGRGLQLKVLEKAEILPSDSLELFHQLCEYLVHSMF